jgi:hypothetical protein
MRNNAMKMRIDVTIKAISKGIWRMDSKRFKNTRTGWMSG